MRTRADANAEVIWQLSVCTRSSSTRRNAFPRRRSRCSSLSLSSHPLVTSPPQRPHPLYLLAGRLTYPIPSFSSVVTSLLICRLRVEPTTHLVLVDRLLRFHPSTARQSQLDCLFLSHPTGDPTRLVQQILLEADASCCLATTLQGSGQPKRSVRSCFRFFTFSLGPLLVVHTTLMLLSLPYLMPSREQSCIAMNELTQRRDGSVQSGSILLPSLKRASSKRVFSDR